MTGIRGDVSKPADLDTLYAAVQEQQGKLDIVFANAEIGEFAPLGQISKIIRQAIRRKREGAPVYHPGTLMTLHTQKVQPKTFGIYETPSSSAGVHDR